MNYSTPLLCHSPAVSLKPFGSAFCLGGMRRQQLPLRQLLLAGRNNAARQTSSSAAALVAGYVHGERELASASTSTSGSESSWRMFSFATAPILAGAAVACAVTAQAEPSGQDSQIAPSESKGFYLLPLASRQRIFFKYEKRIRDKSMLDKVFEYFCTQVGPS